MSEDPKYYDVEDYKRWRRNQGKANKIAPLPNLLAAANWIRKFFDARKTNWAALGSLAMFCLGSRRDMPDIHIVYDDKDFQRIRMKLQTDPRVRLPKDMNSLFSSKLLISTGPKFKDAGCTENADIEVEMIPPGSHGTPPSDILRSNQAMLTLNISGKTTNIKGLNMLYLVKTTVHLCTSQDLLWDPKKDLLWLCRKYGKEIESIRGQLNGRQVQEHFLGTRFFSTLTVEEKHICYHVLLGKDPPPSMTLTPAPLQGQLSSATARPPLASHKPAPSLKYNAPQGSAFLRPTMPIKPKTASETPPNEVGTAASQYVSENLPRKDIALEAPRDSRSRYRNSTVPKTSNASRNISPEARPAKTNTDARLEHMQQHSIVCQAQTVNLQNVAHTSKPQVVRTKKSFPRTNGQTMNAVPVFAHNSSADPLAPKSTAHSPQAVASALPPGFKIQPQDPTFKARANNNTPPSASNAQPQVVAHTHPAHQIIAQRNSIMRTDHNRAADVSVQSIGDDKIKTPSKGLAVVGPEGLYPIPPSPNTKPPMSQPAVQVNKDQGRTAPSSFAFEQYTAALQCDPSLQENSATGFIAELPTDNSTLPQQSEPPNQQPKTVPETPISPPQVPMNFASTSAHADSPVSPPTTYRPFASMIQPVNPEPTVQAPKTMPSPPSFDSLPPSLTIGFRGAQHQSNPRPRSSSSQSSNAPAVLTKYQRYYSPPNCAEASPKTGSSSAPNSRQPSPNRPPLGTYKAYNPYTPPVTPPMQANTEPVNMQQPQPMAQNQSLPVPALAPAPVAPTQSAPVLMDRAPAPVGRISQPTILSAGANAPQPPRTEKSPLPNPLAANPPTPRTPFHTKHDSHQGPHPDAMLPPTLIAGPNPTIPQQHFAPPSAHPEGPQYIAFSAQRHQPPTHQRNVSSESNTSTISHDSEKLAQEYQLDLPSYGSGYSAGARAEADAEPQHKYRLDLPDLEQSRQSHGGFMDGYDFTSR